MSDEAQAERQQIHACIEFAQTDDSLSLNVDHVADDENPAVVLAKFIARNCGALLNMANAERENALAMRKEGFVEANTKHVIETAARRIVGPDGKLVS